MAVENAEQHCRLAPEEMDSFLEKTRKDEECPGPGGFFKSWQACDNTQEFSAEDWHPAPAGLPLLPGVFHRLRVPSGSLRGHCRDD